MDRPGAPYCDWYDVFDEGEQKLVQDGLRNIVQVSTIVSVLFFLSELLYQGGVLNRKPQSVESYHHIKYYFYAIHVRNITMLLAGMDAVRDAVNDLCPRYCDECHFFSFLESFTSVLEIETLTHVCVERYVIAKYITNGWTVPNEHYTLYFYLTLMFAFVYGIFYGSDFAGCMCSFSLILPDIWKKQFVIGLFLLRSVKPTVFTIAMLICARWMENRFTNSMKRRADFEFTKVAVILVIVNVICWAPFSIIRGWVLFYQIFIEKVIAVPSTFILRYAIWLHALAPLVIMITMTLIQLLAHCKIIFKTAQDKKKKA